MNMQDEVDQVVIHELIHAYDDCRAANLDWANCAHHACSEVSSKMTYKDIGWRLGVYFNSSGYFSY